MVTRYLRLAVWPKALVLDYGAPPPTSVHQVWPYLVVVALITVGTATALIYRPAIGFLGAWFCLILAPTSSVIPIVTEVGAERRMYLPLAAVVVLVVSCGWIWLRRRPSAVPALLLVVVAGSLGLTSARRNTDYRSDEVLWRTVVEQAAALACPFQPRGGPAESRPPLRSDSNNTGRRCASILKRPKLSTTLPSTSNGTAISTSRSASTKTTCGCIQTMRPAHNQLGIALAKRGKIEDAIAEYREALRLDPEFAEAHRNLGTSLLQQEKAGEAAEHFERFLALHPDDA